MKIFGLLSLLLAVGLGVYFVYQGDLSKISNQSDGTMVDTTSPIEKAKEAVEALENRNISGVTVYDGVTVDSDTKVLDLSNQSLTGSLKAEIRQLKQLETLNLSNNQFTGLPAEVGQLNNLKTLDLSGNPLTGLPHELGNLSNLRTLDLRGTKYSEADLAIIKAALPASTVVLTD